MPKVPTHAYLNIPICSTMVYISFDLTILSSISMNINYWQNSLFLMLPLHVNVLSILIYIPCKQCRIVEKTCCKSISIQSKTLPCKLSALPRWTNKMQPFLPFLFEQEMQPFYAVNQTGIRCHTKLLSPPFSDADILSISKILNILS